MIPLNLMPFFAQYWPYFLAAAFFYTVFYLAMERTRTNIDRDHEKRKKQLEQQQQQQQQLDSSGEKKKRREAADDSDTDDEIGDQATPAFDECPFIPYQGDKYSEVRVSVFLSSRNWKCQLHFQFWFFLPIFRMRWRGGRRTFSSFSTSGALCVSSATSPCPRRSWKISSGPLEPRQVGLTRNRGHMLWYDRFLKSY